MVWRNCSGMNFDVSKGIGVIIGSVMVTCIIGYGINTAKHFCSYVSTKGVCHKVVESDSARLDISICNETDNIKDASEKRNSDREAVLEFLKNKGVKESDIVSRDCEISDRFRYSSRDNGKRYSVSDTFGVTLNNCHLAKDIAQSLPLALMDQGIYVSAGVRYRYKNLDDLKIEMIEEAAKDARERAEHVAAVSNMKISGLRSLNTGYFSIVGDDSSATNNETYDEERYIKKRVRVVVHGTFDIAPK